MPRWEAQHRRTRRQRRRFCTAQASAVRPRRCGQHVDATFSTPPWSTEAAETTSSAPSGWMRMASLRKARVPCLRQPRVEQHAIQLGTNRRFLSTAHILLSSCVFAASARPPHTSVVMQLRVRRPVWSPTGPARRAASGARRPAVHSERTNRTRNGHMVQTVFARAQRERGVGGGPEPATAF